MSLLRDIQAAAIDSNTNLADLLRKCKVLAARLGNEEFRRWVDQELNGYRSKEDLPEYRILSVTSYGHFFGSLGSQILDALIPPWTLPEKFRAIATTANIMESIGAVVQTVEQSQAGGELRTDWPADMVHYVGARVTIYQDMQCVSAWRSIPRGALVGILDTVRNRILSFVLEIEAEAPDAGEASPDHPPVLQERVTQIFHTHISGSVGNLAMGSDDVTQVSVVQVRQGDFNSLKDYLSGLGIDDTDLQALESVLAEDTRENSQGRIGDQTSGWIGRMITKASSGAWDVGVSVAGTILTRGVSQYLGLPF